MPMPLAMIRAVTVRERSVFDPVGGSKLVLPDGWPRFCEPGVAIFRPVPGAMLSRGKVAGKHVDIGKSPSTSDAPSLLGKSIPLNPSLAGTVSKTSQRTRCRRQQSNDTEIQKILRPFAAVCTYLLQTGAPIKKQRQENTMSQKTISKKYRQQIAEPDGWPRFFEPGGAIPCRCRYS